MSSNIQELAAIDRAALRDQVRTVLIDTLGLADGDDITDESSELFGRLPELDSLTVVELIVALQDRFDIEIDDEEITTDAFATLGSLVGLVDRTLTEG